MNQFTKEFFADSYAKPFPECRNCRGTGTTEGVNYHHGGIEHEKCDCVRLRGESKVKFEILIAARNIQRLLPSGYSILIEASKIEIIEGSICQKYT